MAVRKKKWLGLTINVLSVILTLMVLLLIVSLVLERYPFLAGADYSFKVKGYSMLPVARMGDMVLVRRGVEDIQVGDIICFKEVKEDLKLISHRVIEIQIYPDIMFKTKGDNNEISDGWVKVDSVVGKETLLIPLGFFITRNAFLLMVGLIIVLILIRTLVVGSQSLLLDLDILFLLFIFAFSLNRLLNYLYIFSK